MRLKHITKFHHENEQSECERKSLGSFIRNTATVLTIPRCSSKIQTQLNAGGYSRNMASLALNLLRVGYIKETDVGDLQAIIQKGIQKWVLDKVGDLINFDFSIEITPEINFVENLMYDDDFVQMSGEIESMVGEIPMFLLIEPGNLKTMTVGAKLQKIEDKVPGLGKTAYYMLATCGAKTLRIFTPWMGDYLAQNIWWYGMDNHEDFMEEVSSYLEDENDESELEGALEIGPKAWEESFPLWVTKIENALSEKELKAIAEAMPGSLESEVSTIVLSMIKNQDAALPNVGCTNMDSIYSGMYLHWEENSLSQRLIDDWFENLNINGGEGYIETMGISPIPSKPFQFRKWMVDMEKGFAQLKNIDQLVNLIGVRSN